MSTFVNRVKGTNESLIKHGDSFKSKFGLLAIAASSAVGLGNIWRFPYIVGENGGGAFILIYLFCIVFIGMSVMLSEFIIGRKTRTHLTHGLKILSPNTPWFISGWVGIVTSILTLSFYSRVAGWCLHYMIASVMNGFINLDVDSATTSFDYFIDSGHSTFYQAISLIITVCVVFFGVPKVTERFTKILTPILVGLMVLLAINSMMLPNNLEGLQFLFTLDWQTINANSILVALGHSLFTLSVGMGIMTTYGSYVKKSENLVSSAVSVILADTLIAFLAIIMIFPAVSSYGLNVNEGVGLVFITVTQIFNNMMFGELLGGIFFLLLTILAITSTISLFEVVVSYLQQSVKTGRVKATLLTFLIVCGTTIFSTVSYANSISTLEFLGITIFDFANEFVINLLMPLGALLIVLFTGWGIKKSDVLAELLIDGYEPRYAQIVYFILKYVTPTFIIAVFLNVLIS